MYPQKARVIPMRRRAQRMAGMGFVPVMRQVPGSTAPYLPPPPTGGLGAPMYIQPYTAPAPAPASSSVSTNVSVSPVIQTTVSPQISPVFQQAFQPTGSPMVAGAQQQSPAPQTAQTPDYSEYYRAQEARDRAYYEAIARQQGTPTPAATQPSGGYVAPLPASAYAVDAGLDSDVMAQIEKARAAESLTATSAARGDLLTAPGDAAPDALPMLRNLPPWAPYALGGVALVAVAYFMMKGKRK